MTRLSGDELRDGDVWNGFDYALQVWVVDGVAQSLRAPGGDARARAPCCPALRLAGRRIDDDSRCAAPPSHGGRRRGIEPNGSPRASHRGLSHLDPPRAWRTPARVLFRCPGRTAC